MSRIIARDSEKSGDDNLRGFGEPRSHTSSDWDPAAVVGIAGGTVLKGKELAQIIVGISDLAEAVLGPAFVGSWLLGGDQRERDG